MAHNPSNNPMGTVGILNVGAGDTKLSFDKDNPAERIRAARIVRDMLRRGYALLIEVEVNGEKKFQRALDFDEAVCEYIIADFDPQGEAQQNPETSRGPNSNAQEAVDEGSNASRAAQGEAISDAPAVVVKKGAKQRRVPAENARAVSVARTAGG